MKCIKDFEGVSRHCEAEAQLYLKCRMNNGLMVNEPMTSLGYHADAAGDKSAKS